MKVVFLDRDGTLVAEPADDQLDSLEKLAFLPGVFAGLRLLAQAGYDLVMVTNQDGLGTASFPAERFQSVQQFIVTTLAGEGIHFRAIFICPHRPDAGCPCRKPKTGLLETFLRDHDVALDRSFVLGDRETDVQLAANLGCRAVRLSAGAATAADYATPSFLDACRYIFRRDRTATIRRETRETRIAVAVTLDGSGESEIGTGLPFFDHMLDQIARHASIDLRIEAQGDLQIDEHHTIEDTGLALGEAIRLALGNKNGIARYGFVAPLDESLGSCVLDLSGRPLLVWKGAFTRDRVGDLPTELVEDFFRAVSDGMRATLHLTCEGRNTHHQVEAVFKSFARTLRQAIRRDPDALDRLPSTKGAL